LGYILSQLNTNRQALLINVIKHSLFEKKKNFANVNYFQGGLIEIRQNWQCNFDLDPNKCVPTYEFSLLQSGDDAQSPGINYRYVIKFEIFLFNRCFSIDRFKNIEKMELIFER